MQKGGTASCGSLTLATPASPLHLTAVATPVAHTPLPLALRSTFLKGLTQAEYTPAPTSQEFFLLGDNGYRDSVGTTMAGEMACTTFFINSLSSGAPQADIDTALGLVMAAESDPDKELFVEMLTLLGQDGSNNFLYFVRAFQACVTGVSEAAPSDGLIEYSWTFQSRGEIFVGTLNNSTTALDVYA